MRADAPAEPSRRAAKVLAAVRDELTLRNQRQLEHTHLHVGLAARQRDFADLTQRVPLKDSA
ncbi:hypothetical protein [Streptomyces melanogenes]|uniref:hypothetical protein n=1 Tax=Streptomyces melanogenes TaxID=67326 RepID=UPI00167D6834|nr:hypothetical protein [Streptomyces melanogenes]GGP88936.1 hypothetical protein GCM10010278_79220 [Streptomyces melanogenes]